MATLVVLPDPAVPAFEGKMIHSFGVLTETAVQSAARKMTMELLAQFWQTKFADSSFRLLPRSVLPNEDPEAVYLEMYSAPVQETGGDQPMIHTTGSYLYDLDHLAVNLSSESDQLHLGFYDSVRHIHVLQHEIQGWNQLYTTAQREARRNQRNYMEAQLMRQTETQLRTAAEAKLLQTETELQKLREEKAEWKLKEKDYLDTISKLKDRATDSEAECRQLQTQVDDQQDFMTLHGYFEAKTEDRVKELETRLERNKKNIALLTRTAVYLRDKAARALQTWEISDSIRVDEIHELRNQLPEESQPLVRKEDFKLIPTELRLHLCPHEEMPPAIETEEVVEAVAAIDAIFPEDYPEAYKRVLSYKKPRVTFY
jgi:myosin heavy subunit